MMVWALLVSRMTMAQTFVLTASDAELTGLPFAVIVVGRAERGTSTRKLVHHGLKRPSRAGMFNVSAPSGAMEQLRRPLP